VCEVADDAAVNGKCHIERELLLVDSPKRQLKVVNWGILTDLPQWVVLLWYRMSVDELTTSSRGARSGAAPCAVPACLTSNDCSGSVHFEMFTLYGLEWCSRSRRMVYVGASHAASWAPKRIATCQSSIWWHV
jgi:hypothetical protein